MLHPASFPHRKKPQRCINKCRHIKVKWNENTFASQHDTTFASNLGIIAAACHTMSLSTQGKEALRNVHGDLACVSVCVRVKQAQLLNLTAIPNNLQWIVLEVCYFTVKTRYCHQVMELTHVSLSLTGISRQIHTGAMAWACCGGGQEVLLGFKKRKLWSSVISVMQVGSIMSFEREEAFPCIYRSTVWRYLSQKTTETKILCPYVFLWWQSTFGEVWHRRVLNYNSVLVRKFIITKCSLSIKLELSPFIIAAFHLYVITALILEIMRI